MNWKNSKIYKVKGVYVMKRKELVKKMVKMIRESCLVYSRFMEKGDVSSAISVYDSLITKIDFAEEIGLINFDYFGYLLDLIRVKRTLALNASERKKEKNMKINGSVKVFVYKKKEMEFEQGREKMKYYRLIVDVDDEVDEIPCSEDVYNKVEIGKEILLTFVYNTKADRNPFKFVSVGLSSSEVGGRK